MSSVYEYESFSGFIGAMLGPKTQRRGLKTQLAQHLGVHPSFISAVMNGTQTFSLEHGWEIAKFFDLNDAATEYLLALLQAERAGRHELKRHFLKQAAQLKSQHLSIKGRIGESNSLTSEQLATYYSTWEYGAVHIAHTIPALRDLGRLAATLGLSRARCVEILSFLEETGLVKRAGEHWSVQFLQRISKESPHILQHHTNWRLKAIQSLPQESLNDLHYSGVHSLSESDAQKIKDLFLELIQSNSKRIKESPEERLFAVCVDWFEVK